MSPANRIILNTLANYGQSLVAIVVGLFSARWTLQALGQSDFGLFGVVGSLILMVSILNVGLSVGVVRFFSYSIGSSATLPSSVAEEDLQKWFNTAFSIHILLPFAIVLVGLPLGDYAIRNWLTIPADRIEVSISVYRISLATAFISIISVPYVSMFRAKQQMIEIAVINIIQSLCTIALAWTLLHVKTDRLAFYATGMMLITGGGYVLQMIMAAWLFPACRPRIKYLYQLDYMRKLLSYVGWKLFGSSCYTLRENGTPIFVNLVFGPVVNAAYSIASRLSTQSASLSAALSAAFQPALTSVEGSGDSKSMLAMATQICNFGTLLVALFAIPLILEMDSLLNLWLVEPPLHAANICRWLLAILIIDKMTLGPALGIGARGKIAAYEIVQGLMFVLALPVMWLLYRTGYGTAAIGIGLFSSSFLYCIGRIVFAKYLISFDVMVWIRKTVLPLTLMMLVAATLVFLAASMFDAPVYRLLVAGSTSVLTQIIIAWLLIFNENEKKHAASILRYALKFSRKNAIKA
jgi:O-antigen/teichoic acid export membrane protein